jgi:hypothetical protein
MLQLAIGQVLLAVAVLLFYRQCGVHIQITIRCLLCCELLFQGTLNMLSQIGQDTAIAEQQMKIVNMQMEKIKHLKSVRPFGIFSRNVYTAYIFRL